MNFAQYYNMLQQLEKPTFVFDRFDRESCVTYLKKLDNYLTEKGANGAIKRKNFNITVELLQQNCNNHSDYTDYNHFVKFYENENSCLFYSIILYDNQDYEFIVKATTIVENRDKDELKQLYRDIIKQEIKPLFSFIGLVDLSRLRECCYFNLTTTEKDYFTLEIIAVIHKVIA